MENACKYIFKLLAASPLSAALILSPVVSCGVSEPYYTSADRPYIVEKGDLNVDGTVNIIDRIILNRYLAKWSGYEQIDKAISDFNDDGNVNIADRLILTRYLAGWSNYSIYFNQAEAEKHRLITEAKKFLDSGNTEKAYELYSESSKIGNFSGYALSPVKTSSTLNYDVSTISLTIEPAAEITKNMKLRILSENLADVKKVNGKIDGSSKQLISSKDCLTTDWFDVEGGRPVTLTGGFNCSVWQFIDKNGKITAYTDKDTFHSTSGIYFSNKSSSTIDLPKNCVKARVTYYDSTIKNTVASDGSIAVIYGKIFKGFSGTAQEFELPDLSENERISYINGSWTLINADNTRQSLSLPEIAADRLWKTEISGTVCGKIKLKGVEHDSFKESGKAAVYGIKYNPSSSNVLCTRTADAIGMKFDYKIGNNRVNGTGNDFDKAYPWSGIKLCNVYTDKNGRQAVAYEGEPEFSYEKENGNVMVEIPKFYTKRIVENGVEDIRISGTKYDGFALEPIFLKPDGSEAEKAYISAYICAEEENKVVSKANMYPSLLLRYNETLKMAKANGDGFSEVSFSMINAIQKLFLIETGTLDSSSIFGGDSAKLYYYDSEERRRCTQALKSEKNTNKITVEKNYLTVRLLEYTSVIIFEGWDDYSNLTTPRREIIKITETNDKKYIIEFDGEPLDIVQGKTLIASFPEKTGKTKALDYSTAMVFGVNGTVSFRYRYIENLYGSALVMLNDDAYVQNSLFVYTDAAGKAHVISEKAANQHETLGNTIGKADLTSIPGAKSMGSFDLANYTLCISQMSYDANNPTVMVPTVTGEGASVFSGYCDYWHYQNVRPHNKCYLSYGGADDNNRLTGVFEMRADIYYTSFKGSFHSSRIMYKP